ncbi:Wadjet anti-phage system protein JetD domain-containing protein [Streptomyces sp. 796.1]|uniref:Wadjet anti-phage system protein JetD domain-containing protein n=1 Tax=Streptomyces sp. 796.1 TaxID=3163029 RepID=UPI0039C8C417
MSPAADTPKEELYEGLLRRARAQRWRAGSRKKITQAELFEELHKVRIPSPESELDEVVLTRCLDALAAEGRLALIWARSPRKDRVPSGIYLPASAAPTPSEVHDIGIVHHDLFRLLEGQLRVTEQQRMAYRAISDWLHTVREVQRDVMDVPRRERSLQIFGKREYGNYFPEAEKALDGKSFGGPLLQRPEEFNRLIRAFPTDPPGMNAHFSDLHLEERSTSWQEGDVLLVVENSATYWSLVEQLRTMEHRIGCVAWGVGAAFSAAVRTLVHAHVNTGHERRRDIREVRYFGDLDKSGLTIPTLAAERVADHKLTVRPTVELYKALLRLGTPMPAKKSERAGKVSAAALVDWLADPYFAEVTDLLDRGERLAQEWVGRQYLARNTEWQKDVQ